MKACRILLLITLSLTISYAQASSGDGGTIAFARGSKNMSGTNSYDFVLDIGSMEALASGQSWHLWLAPRYVQELRDTAHQKPEKLHVVVVLGY